MTTQQFWSTPARQVSLDVVRGVAVLGILLMNIQSFSNPTAAYLNPTAYGEFSGNNFYLWIMTHLLADMKFMSVFSMLFGAGILLFSDRADQKDLNATQLHYQRNFWLLVFGLLHAHFIWYGDILYAYAMCAFFAYWFRNFSIKKLIISALIFLVIGSGYSLFVGISIPYIPAESIQQIKHAWQPDHNTLMFEINAYRDNYFAQMKIRHNQATLLETQVFLTMFIWRVMAMMCIGMACYKFGLFSLKQSQKFYLKFAFIGISLGSLLTLLGMKQNLLHNFSLQYSFFIGNQFNYWGSILTALGYICLIACWVKSNNQSWLIQRLAKVGQMAFTNYIVHSIVFTFIFYGHGLGLFGQLSRLQCLTLVLAMWLIQLWYSTLWLKRFQFGPLEWLWRSLTYWKLQPLTNKQ